MTFGYFDLSLWFMIGYALVSTHITIVAVTVYLHRCQAHRALTLAPAVSHFFRFWLWLGTGIVTREWVAIHRCHHANVESKDDPHSPQIVGIKKVLLEGSELYRQGKVNQEILQKYGHCCPDDWIERNLYQRYNSTGIVLMLLLALVLFGPIGLTAWAVQMMWIPFFAAGVINGVGHYLGYRNFETADTSRNIVPWGILIGGEELHNNHHAYASSAKLSNRWYEFDIGWLYIRILAWLGLAKIKKVYSQVVMVPDKLESDLDTITAVVTHRFRVMSDYTHSVLQRVYQDTSSGSTSLGDSGSSDSSGACGSTGKAALTGGWVSIKQFLVPERSSLCEEARQHLDALLSHHHELKVTHEYKEKLLQLWRRQACSYEDLLQLLQEWCACAKDSQIKALEEFALRIPRYASRDVY